jgi:hypothetical protein
MNVMTFRSPPPCGGTHLWRSYDIIASNTLELISEVVKFMGLDAFGYDFTALLYVPILPFFWKKVVL